MSHKTLHPSDETLLRAVERELSRRRRTVLDGHLAGCERCRARLVAIRSSLVAVTEACRHERGTHRTDALRAQLSARLTDLARALDNRPWWVRLVQRLDAIPRLLPIDAALATLVLVTLLLHPWPESVGLGRTASIERGALPIESLTPGATRHDDVDVVCEGTLAAKAPVPVAIRRAVLRDYQMETVPEEEYELDYLITPELGGSSDRRNLWPQRYGMRVWNARVKDELERLLPQLVCQGALDLQRAQHDIATNWIAAYKMYLHTDHPLSTFGRFHTDEDDFHPHAPLLISLHTPAASTMRLLWR